MTQVTVAASRYAPAARKYHCGVSIFMENQNASPVTGKPALNLKGIISNNLRLPLVKSTDELQDRIAQLAKEAGL